MFCLLFQGMLTTSIGAYGYAPRFHLTWTWSTKLGHQRDCYIDHTRAFFKILRSVYLDSDIHRYHALTQFDFRKLSFGISCGVSHDMYRSVLLRENVRNFNYKYTPSLTLNPAGFAVETTTALCLLELVGILLIKVRQTLRDNWAWRGEGSACDRYK